MIMPDVKKAYNRIDRNSMEIALRAMNISKTVIKLIILMYT